MNINKTISESAFLVNESRSRRVDISKDVYAHLWTTDSTKDLWEDFKTNVYAYDDIELSLRNRFFLDNLNVFNNSINNQIFINIGAGFTSYPFLVNKPCKCIEVDLPHVIDFKHKKVQLLKKENNVPDRDIEFIAVDLCKKSDIDYLKDELCSIVDNYFSFILLEGITYYLDKHVLDYLLEMCLAMQKPGSILAFDFWDPKIASNPVFKRFITFFEQRFGHKKNKYTLFNNHFLKSINGYSILELTNIQQLEKKYLNTTILQDYNTIIPENYVILKRDDSQR